MSKKKQKHSKEKKQKTSKKDEVKDYMIEISQSRSDVKTFIEKFKSDVDRKKKGYQSYSRKLRKKRTGKQ